ncbi:MAG: hypothetical protein PHN49_02625 [Candidatus Omnitrophica bacterium]|nr:hypothetical protein [Candidatus Omnitrophota bacterium]MDD5670513.1 hypothetical protein [Candidatus Omnitrophota bacterium]
MSDQTDQCLLCRRAVHFLHFEYGGLDERTFWIANSRSQIIRIDRFTLNVLLDLNAGKSMEEVAHKYHLTANEIMDTYRNLEQKGFVVAEHTGKIKRHYPEEDIEMAPYLLVALIMAVGQLVYFTYTAKTILMNRLSEGVLIALIATLAIFAHEFGHYIFCLKYGHVRPRMKFAFARIFPIVYVDTDVAWRLTKQRRMMINLGGVFFDLMVNTLAVILAVLHPSLEYYVTPFLLTQYSRISVLFNPLLKGDGYWVLSDLLGIVNMEKQGVDALKQGKLNLFSVYGIVTVIFSLLGFVGMFWFFYNLARPPVERFVVPLFR